MGWLGPHTAQTLMTVSIIGIHETSQDSMSYWYNLYVDANVYRNRGGYFCMMPEWSIDGKKSINLHYDDVDASIRECEEPKEMVNTKMCQIISPDIRFLENNWCYAIQEKHWHADEIIDLKDMNRHHIVPVVVVSLAGDHNVDEDAQEHHGHGHPRHDQAYLHERNIDVAGRIRGVWNWC